jgi:hypothetical protein
MIKNEREYRITKAHLAGFEGGLITNDKRKFPANVDPGMKKLMPDAIASEIEVLQAQIDRYEKLRDGHHQARNHFTARATDRPYRSPHRRQADPAPARRAHRRRRAASPALGGQRLQRSGARPAAERHRRPRRADSRDDHVQQRGLVECQATFAVLMSLCRRGLLVLRLRQWMYRRISRAWVAWSGWSVPASVKYRSARNCASILFSQEA